MIWIAWNKFTTVSYSFNFMYLIIDLVLEVYLWLSNKYQQAFVEVDLCKLLIERVCEIIDQILLSKS